MAVHITVAKESTN